MVKPCGRRTSQATCMVQHLHVCAAREIDLRLRICYLFQRFLLTLNFDSRSAALYALSQNVVPAHKCGPVRSQELP